MIEPKYIQNLRKLSTEKTTSLNEALAYIDGLHDALIRANSEIDSLYGDLAEECI